jgi:hypothetical protein
VGQGQGEEGKVLIITITTVVVRGRGGGKSGGGGGSSSSSSSSSSISESKWFCKILFCHTVVRHLLVLRLGLGNVHKSIFELSIRLVRNITASNDHLRILSTAYKLHIRYF